MTMQTSCDILIIGGGAAGCVLAARLSEDAGTRVVLVEAGQDTPPGAVPADIQDAFPVSYFNPSYFWPGLNASANLGSAATPYQQPRVMGGGSSVMGMWALRGMPGDYDAWREAGAAGWGWDDMLPMFRRIEHDRDYDGPEHGRDGPIPVGRHPRATWPKFVDALVEACAKRQLPLRGDLNTDFADGAFPTPYATEHNRRVSTANGYLTDAVRRRPNLEIVADATATRIVFDGARATGAEIRHAGVTTTINAREVIVSAGGIHSPAVLMRSGIGPAADLKALGIVVQRDLPGVGRALQNHCVVNLSTRIEPHARRPAGIRTYGVACARVSSRAAGAMDGDLHFQFMQRLGAYAHGERLGMVGAALYAPVSRGAVTLTSADPAVEPKVDFRFLSDDLDRVRMRQAVRLGLDLLHDPAVAGTHGDVFLVVPSSLTRKLNRPSLRNRLLSHAIAAWLDAPAALHRHALARIGHTIDTQATSADAEIDALLDFIMPVFHPTGSCRMGRADDPDAVIDPHCRVRGVDGLRVIDASVMPVIPRANTCFPTMAVAERAADLMKAERVA
jgi:5-(hydroxymethyl)furfural/furfural oxidase